MDDFYHPSSRGLHNHQDPYQCRSSTSGTGNDSAMDSPLGLHSHVEQILAEFRFINSKFQKQDEVIKGLEESNSQLTAKVQMMEAEIQDFKQAKKGRAVIGSNDHPDLKVSQIDCT